MEESEERMTEMLRKGYAAFNRGDMDKATAKMSPDVEVKRVGGLGGLRGRDAAKGWLEPDAFESQQVEPKRFEVSGDKVVVDLEITSRGKGSGMELRQTFFQVWTFAAGEVTGMEIYDNRTEALAAAGIG